MLACVKFSMTSLLLSCFIQGYESSQAYAEGSYDTASYGRQSDALQDQQRGAGGGFPKKRLQPSEPSPHVIFLGLDPDFTEADVCRLHPLCRSLLCD